MLRFEQLNKSYGDKHVLKDIDFDVEAGEVVSLIGASGSGKTTLLRCVNLLERPDSGLMTIDGNKYNIGIEHITNKDIKTIRSFSGMVFQSYNLFPHMSIIDNAIEAPINVLKRDKAQVLEEAKGLLKQVGLENEINKYPGMLSGGQQQRAAIARAMMMKPKILLLDEPTSALDPLLIKEVLGVIRSFAEKGQTMVIVTHEMKFAREVSDRVCFLYQGEIIEQSNPDEFFENPKTEPLKIFLQDMFE